MLLDSPWLVEQPIVIACFHDELSDGEAAFAILKYANEKGGWQACTTAPK